ncbi:MAG: hypothetical protein ACREM3_23885 [Candidatus Rokuibacteriota bacterium]
MTLRVRPVDLEEDREELIGVLERNLTAVAHRVRFDWFYRRNPAGRAWSWIVYDTSGGRSVGAASVFPREVWLDGRVRRCGQVGDFAIDAGYRSLGPAVMLQRATLSPVDDGTLAFCYDCPPHAAGMAPLRRLGLEPNARMLRYVRPVRVNRYVRRLMGGSLLARPLAWIGNRMLGVITSRSRPEAGLEVALHSARFGEEFTRLDAAAGSRGLIRGRRTADILNWRYRDDPLREYIALTVRGGGELMAYLIVQCAGEDAYVVDVSGGCDREVVRVLFEAAVDVTRQRRMEALYAMISDQAGLGPTMNRAWMRYRSPGAYIVAAAKRSSVDEAAVASVRWGFLHSDVLA